MLSASAGLGSSKSCDSEDMIYVQYQNKVKAKCSTAKKTYPKKARPSLRRRDEGQVKDQQSAMARATKPNEMVKLAPYKLALVIKCSLHLYGVCKVC